MPKYLVFTLAVFTLFLVTKIEAYLFYSPSVRQEYFSVEPEDSLLILKEAPLVAASDSLFTQDLPLQRDTDYRINYQTGQIHLLLTRSIVTSIRVRYTLIPSILLGKKQLYEPIELQDTTKVVYKQKANFDWLTNNKLNLSGSKSVSISVGNADDFDLKQSLFLKLDGEIGPNMKVEAQLNDSQSPITPEGDSRELSNLDQVFLRLYGHPYEIAFGDLEMPLYNSEFLNYTARVEGLKASYFPSYSVQGALAIAKGKEATYEFTGIEGKQGPYYVYAQGVLQSVQIVAGSEKVLQDGTELQRGTDYIIDYAEGSIQFKTLITNNSRLRVEFQYSDEYYRQNIYAANNQIPLGDRITLRQKMVIINDDKNNPIEGDFTESDKTALKNAGDNVVWGNGIYEVTAGQGLYVKRISPQDSVYYEYVGSDSTANYLIYFSYVGYGYGSYNQLGNSRYVWVGYPNGSYVPRKRLTPPQQKGNYDVELAWNGSFLKLKLESMITQYDRNTFSSLDDGNNTGGIHYISASFQPDWDVIKPDIEVYTQIRQSNTTSITNIRASGLVDDLSSFVSRDSLKSNEYGSKGSLQQTKWLNLSWVQFYNYSPNLFTEQYWNHLATLKQQRWLPETNWILSTAKQTNDDLFLQSIQTDKNEITTFYKWRGITPKYMWQTRKTVQEDSLGTRFGSSYHAQTYQVEFEREQIWATKLSWQEDKNRQLLTRWEQTQASRTATFDHMWQNQSHSIRFSATSRQIRTPEEGKQNLQLAEWHSNHRLFHEGVNLATNYTANNVEFSPRIRELVYVGDGLGPYDSTGVVVSDGDYDYNYVEGPDSLKQLTTEINTDLSLFLHPGEFSKQKDAYLSRWQSESYMLLSENSNSGEKWDLYFFQPSVWFEPTTTIYGRQLIRQTIWYDIIKQKSQIKLSYQKEKSLDQRYQDVEKNKKTNFESVWQLYRWQGMDWESSYQWNQELDSRYFSEETQQKWSVNGRKRLAQQFILDHTVDYAVRDGGKQDGSNSFTLSSYGLAENITWFARKSYRVNLRAEWTHNQRKGSSFLSFLAENRQGDLFKWTMLVNYQVNSFTTASFEYTGNSYPGQNDVHKMSLEVKAEF